MDLGAETKTKVQGLFAATNSFEHILAFSLVFNGLDPLKPLASELLKCNQDIYKACLLNDWQCHFQIKRF